jgi:hypothetical protein
MLRALDPLLHRQYEDMLHKKSSFVENFYQLVSHSIEPPFAISVDGLWGTGKTTIMQMLQSKLQERDGGYPVFWFNPWEYQEAESVVLAFLQYLAEEAQTTFGEAVKEGLKILSVVGLLGMNLAINALLKPLVNLTMEDVQKTGEKYEEAQKKEYEKYKNLIKIIQDDFKCLIDNISNQEKYKGKPVIIFLDDLDRCLPDKTIQLLEAVKNLFVVPDAKVIFICGIDTHIAKQFIKSHYNGIEDTFAIEYFRKIFNLIISMPYNPDIYEIILDYVKNLYDWNDPEKEKALAEMVITRGLQTEMLSVRKYLSIISNFYTFQKFNPEYTFNPEGDFVVHLLILKEAWQPLYEKIIKETIKDRLQSIEKLLNNLVENNEGNISPEQIKFLKDYFANDKFPFHKLNLFEWLSKYPTLV